MAIVLACSAVTKFRILACKEPDDPEGKDSDIEKLPVKFR